MPSSPLGVYKPLAEPNIKKKCMDFILSNIVSVKQSEGWSKLKKEAMHRDLWVELLESVAEKHFAANTVVSAHTKSVEGLEPEPL
jgi:hypothetical protein